MCRGERGRVPTESGATWSHPASDKDDRESGVRSSHAGERERETREYTRTVHAHVHVHVTCVKKGVTNARVVGTYRYTVFKKVSVTKGESQRVAKRKHVDERKTSLSVSLCHTAKSLHAAFCVV